MVKIKLIILFILCYSGLVFGQKESYNDTLVDLNTINLRMDNDDFQFMCLEDALKNDPLQVYELYITPKYCDYELSSEEITKAKQFVPRARGVLEKTGKWLSKSPLANVGAGK